MNRHRIVSEPGDWPASISAIGPLALSHPIVACHLDFPDWGLDSGKAKREERREKGNPDDRVR